MAKTDVLHASIKATLPLERRGRITRSLLRHRKFVGLLWLAIGITGLALVGSVGGRLTSSATYPGLSSYQAGLVIDHTYGNGGNISPSVVIVTLPHGQRVVSPIGSREVATTFAALDAVHGLRVISYPEVNDPRLVSKDGRSALGIVFGDVDQPTSTQLTQLMRASAPAGVALAATSLPDLLNAPGSGGNGVLGEVALGALGALLVLVLVFGSYLAIVPLLIALVSILTTFLLIGVITIFTQVSQLVEYLVALIGLGVAVDYSLIIVTRWRDERDRGQSNHDAIMTAMNTAGRTVALSGATVGVGLVTLVLVPNPIIRSLGYGGLLIPLVTVLASVTLLPVVLSAWGPRLDHRTRWAKRRHERRAGGASRAWVAWTRAVIRHRVLAITAATLILVALFGAALGMRVGEVQPNSLAQHGSAELGLVTLHRDGFAVGFVSPIEILIPDRTAPHVLLSALRAVTGVRTVVAPVGPEWHRDGSTLVDVFANTPTSSAPNQATVSAVRSTVASLTPGSQVAGDGPMAADLVHAFYSRFPLIVSLIALISLLALFRAFRSIVLALKAVTLNLLGVGAVFGALVLFWQRGYGAHFIWGIRATGAIVAFVPLLVFSFLFGLSMDYEVFILSRVKEAHDAGLSTDEAVVEGLGHTGRLVTSAAIIMIFAFVALGSGAGVPLKIFATAMAIGILIDATIIRALLVPAVVSKLGRWSWWPAGDDRVFDDSLIALENGESAVEMSAQW